MWVRHVAPSLVRAPVPWPDGRAGVLGAAAVLVIGRVRPGPWSQAGATMANQIGFLAKALIGRLRGPVSFAIRMQSSRRAQRRC